MGCDTKGYVITECKDVKFIAERIKKEIGKIKGKNPKIKHNFGNPNAGVNPTYDPTSDYMTFDFFDGEDSRHMFVFLGCDCDAAELGDKKIIFNLGSWGNSGELIKRFLTLFQDLGTCYFHENDCDGEPVEFKN